MLKEQKNLLEISSAYKSMICEDVKSYPDIAKAFKGNVTLYSVTPSANGIKLKFKVKELDETKTISSVQTLVKEKLESAGFKDISVKKYGDNMLKIAQPKKLFMKFQGKTALTEGESLDEEFANLVLGSVNSKGRDGAVLYNPGKNKNIPSFSNDDKNYGLKVKVWKKHLENSNEEKTLNVLLQTNGRWKIV